MRGVREQAPANRLTIQYVARLIGGFIRIHHPAGLEDEGVSFSDYRPWNAGEGETCRKVMEM
eukprot:1124859-Rhodomonas_salina.1